MVFHLGPLARTLACVLGLAMIGCSSPSSDSDDPEDLSTVLVACGLGTPGYFPAQASTPYDECFMACVTQGSCAEIESLVCVSGDAGAALSSSCTDRCGAHTHTCGDGEVVPPGRVCDDNADCEDLSDENDCPGPFVCANGAEVSNDSVCNGYFDCSDQSDEPPECPEAPTFACASGSMSILEDWRCDGEADCQDASDEDGCLELLCP